MKKILLILLFLVLSIGLVGCGNSNNPDDSDDYYTIFFHKNDGSGDVKTQRVLKDSTETLIVTLMPNEFERDTHEFVGWSRNFQNTQYIDVEDEAEIQINSNRQLYAIWILSEAGEFKIRQDYLAKLITEFSQAAIEDISIEKYYGTFGGNDVVRMDDKYSEHDDTERTFIFGRYGEPLLIRYSGFDRVFIWNNGIFYGLDSTAVNNFSLPHMNPFSTFANDLGINFWDFNKIVNRLNGLSMEMELLIVDSWNQYRWVFYTLDDFWSYNEYYGTYNDSVVFNFLDVNMDVLRTIFVGGQIFEYGSYIYVWQEGEIYKLREAYNLGLLTEEDIRDIAYYNNLGCIDLHRYIYVNYWDRLTIFIPDFHLYESNFYLSVNNLDELRELYDSNLFTEEVLRAIARDNYLDYDLLFGGK